MLGDDVRLAVDAATRAGQLLLQLRGLADREPADLAADRLIADALLAARGADTLLSEEIASVGDRLAAERVWIVDPLDGTREYGELGRSDWAVHIALWVRGRLEVGVVALPSLGEVWSSADEHVDAGPRPIRRIVVSRTRAPAWASAVAEEFGAELIPMGSAGAKTAAVLRGDADVYLHDGGQYEWDSAAPVAVARHYGFHASRADGCPLQYNQADPYLPDLVICPDAQARDLLACIARHRAPVTVGRTQR